MPYPRLVRGDLDGFFALFVGNLVNLMLIAVLCSVVCGFPPKLVAPGRRSRSLLGNAFYT